MEESGCFYVNLSVESASESMLRSMNRDYTVRQVRDSLEALSRSHISFGASLMFGAPGETLETIAETLCVLDDYRLPLGVWITIGVYLWTDYQDIVAEARRTGFLKDDKELFTGAAYLSPDLPKSYLRDLPEMLWARSGYSVQFNKPSEKWDLIVGTHLLADTVISNGLCRSPKSYRICLRPDPHRRAFERHPFDYLTELQEHACEVKSNPSLWMPWKYRDIIR